MVFFLIKAIDMYLIYFSLSASVTLSLVQSDLPYDFKLPFLIRNYACWFVAIQSDATSMLVRKSIKRLMGVFKDFSVCLKNKNININKTDKWKERNQDIHVKHNTIHISQIYLNRALTLVFHSAFTMKSSTVRQTHTSPQVENTSNPAKV
jgi:hypothetical protein